ncbi:hypothetical protein EDD11_004467 [Mortierella claussenii]|nr:hypothetical protein EDD11_004467 [Mortierella claussenii]
MEKENEEDIIRSRLSVNEKALRKLTNHYHRWSKALSTGSNEEIEKELHGMLREIASFELSLSKTRLIAEMAQRERLNYQQEQMQTEAMVAQSQQEIESLVRELEEAKQERANKILYDQLAAEISQFPSRESSQQSVQALQAEIEELENEAVHQSMVMDLRKKQFFTALTCLQSIEGSIEEDQREEERRLFNKRTQNDDDIDDDEEGGFGEAMEGVEGEGTVSTPAQAAVSGQSQTLSQEGALKGSVESSPALSATHVSTPGGSARPEEGSVSMLDLQYGRSTDSMGTGTGRIMDEASQKRKERLEQLRKRKLESTSNGDRDVSLSFRNYTPINNGLKTEDSKISTPADIGDTVEAKMEGVVEQVIKEEDEKRAKDVDIFTLAPKKPNWDLKRDIEPKLLKLEKKTRAAVIELIRRERPNDLSMA